MHELAITQDMIELVREHAEKAGARKVGRINLVVGELTGFVGECVQFYFDHMTKGTIMEDAELFPQPVDAGTAVKNSRSWRWTGPARPAKATAYSLSAATSCS